MAFEVVDSKIAFEGAVFNVRKDTLRLPGGDTVQLDIVEHHGAVTLLPLDQDGQIWFIRQYRHAAGKVLLELPAGACEAGEPPLESAQREIREEIGMAASELRLLGEFFLAPGYSTEYMYVYLASGLYPDPLPGDADEFIEIEKIPAREAIRLAESGKLDDSKSLIAMFWARPILAQMGLLG